MKTILLIIAAISFVMIPAEAATPMLQVLWTGGCMVVFAISVKVYEKFYMSKEEQEEKV